MVISSNKSLQFYPDNAPYHFKARISQTLDLQGK